MTNIGLFLCIYKFVSNMAFVANCKHGNRNIVRHTIATTTCDFLRANENRFLGRNGVCEVYQPFVLRLR